MTWQQEAVKKWIDWQASASTIEAALIPADVQVGKILEFYECDDSKVIEFIDLQVSEDQNPAFRVSSLDDGYWKEVKTAFYNLQINQLMMAD